MASCSNGEQQQDNEAKEEFEKREKQLGQVKKISKFLKCISPTVLERIEKLESGRRVDNKYKRFKTYSTAELQQKAQKLIPEVHDIYSQINCFHAEIERRREEARSSSHVQNADEIELEKMREEVWELGVNLLKCEYGVSFRKIINIFMEVKRRIRTERSRQTAKSLDANQLQMLNVRKEMEL